MDMHTDTRWRYLSIGQHDLYALHRMADKRALVHRFLETLFARVDVLRRDRVAQDAILKYEVLLQWDHVNKTQQSQTKAILYNQNKSVAFYSN